MNKIRLIEIACQPACQRVRIVLIIRIQSHVLKLSIRSLVDYDREHTPSQQEIFMFIRSFILSIQLFFDQRVPILIKLIPIGTVLYFLSPLDVLPDLLPYGLVDDFAILIFMLNLFVQMSPETVISEHMARMSKHDRIIRIISNLTPLDNMGQQYPRSAQNNPNNVIDGDVIK